MELVSQTRTARIERTPDGVVIARIMEGARQEIQDAKDNVAASAAACRGKKSPLLSDIRLALPLEPETRHYYTGKQLTENFTALAILVHASAFGRMMGNIYIRVAKPGIPTRLFASEAEALAWLRKYRA